MKLINSLNVLFLLAISANAITVLSNLDSPTASIALPPNFASASPPTAVQKPVVGSASAPSPIAASAPSPIAASESAISTAPAPSPTASSEDESAISPAPSPSPTAASEDESASNLAPAPSPIAASDDYEFKFDAATSELSASDTTELVQICDTTSNPELCKSTISSHIDESTMDPTSALKTEIKEAIKVVEGGVAKLKALSKDSAASEVEIACYDTCLENFDLAIFDLKSGLDSIVAKDTGTMESVLAAVESNLMTCDDTFAEMGVESPLDNLSTKMKKYAGTCLEISKLLM